MFNKKSTATKVIDWVAPPKKSSKKKVFGISAAVAVVLAAAWQGLGTLGKEDTR